MEMKKKINEKYEMEEVKKGKDVMVEKKIEIDIKVEIEEVEEERENGRVLMVGNVIRLNKDFEKIIEMVKRGEIGDIRYVNQKRVGIGKFNKELDEIWDIEKKDIQMIIEIKGEEKKVVRGEGVDIIDNMKDLENIKMEFKRGIRGNIFDQSMKDYRESRISVKGKKGMDVLEDGEEWERKIEI